MRRTLTTFITSLSVLAFCVMAAAPQAHAQRQALSLSGEGIVEAADAPDLDIAGPQITLEAWIKHDGQSDENAILVNKGTSGNGYRLSFYGSGEEPGIRFGVDDVDYDNDAIFSNAGIPAHQWTHVAATYDGSQFALYINGELDNTRERGVSVGTNDDPLRIGTDNGGTGRFYSGQLDELRLWNVARNQFQIDPYAPLAGDESGLVAYYTFDDVSEWPVEDLAGNNNELMQSGATPLVTPGIYPVPPYVFALSENGQVELQWTNRGDGSAAQFKVYRSTTPDGSDRTEVSTIDGGTTSFTDSGLENGTRYYYEVTSLDAEAQESDYSQMVTARPYATLGGGSLTMSGEGYATMSDRQSLDGYDQSLVNFNNTITVEVWVKHDGQSVENAILVNKGSSGNGYRLSFYGSGEEPGIRFGVDDVDYDNDAIFSNAGIPAHQWTHVAATYDGSQFALYINGELDNTRERGVTIGDNEDPLRIGTDNGGTGRFYSGQLDELRLWNVARSQPEIEADYAQELTGDEENLITYFRFNDVGGSRDNAEGLTLSQSSDEHHETMELWGDAAIAASGVFPLPPYGYANGGDAVADVVWHERTATAAPMFTVYRSTQADGSDRTNVASVDDGMSFSDTDVTNGTVYYYEVTATDAKGQESDYSAVDPALASATPGGTALVLDGDNDYATLTDRQSLDGYDQSLVNFDNTITVEVWIKHDGQSDENAIVFSKGSTGNGYSLSLAGSGAEPTVRFGVDDVDYDNDAIFSNAVIPANQWTHVAATYDGSQFALYINGELDNTRERGVTIGDNGDPLRIGADNGGTGRFYSGQLDEMRLWNVARSQPEIEADYAQELMGDEEGLIAYFRFDEPGSMMAHSSATLPMTAELIDQASMGETSALPAETSDVLPTAVALDGNYPNPFSHTSTIRYALPKPADVHLAVFDLLGREVATLVDAKRPAGTHDVMFEANGLSSGVYLYRFEADGVVLTKTLTIVR